MQDGRDEDGGHAGDGTVFAAEVFEGGTEVVEVRAVENQETVVEGGGGFDGEGRVLFVEFGEGGRGQVLVAVFWVVAMVTAAEPRFWERMSRVVSSQ